MLAQASRFTNGTDPASPADRTFADIEAAGLETLTSVRRLIGLLRTDPSTSAGPRLTDVERIVEGLRTTHPSTDLVIDDTVRTNWVPPDLANTVQRLVQEAATNVLRHGDPSAPVRFTFRSTGTSFELTVENRSLDTTTGAGYGLVGMRERVDALGGTFDAGPVGVDGWMVACGAAAVEYHRSDRRHRHATITVLLADDQAMVRAGFRMIIESQPDMTVVGETDNGRAAVDLAQRLQPDVCLLDIRMPVLDGLAATRLLAGPDVPRPLARRDRDDLRLRRAPRDRAAQRSSRLHPQGQRSAAAPRGSASSGRR